LKKVEKNIFISLLPSNSCSFFIFWCWG